MGFMLERLVTTTLFALLPAFLNAQEIADTIYTGGPILTINDAQPSAEAIAVKDGVIIAVGSLADVALHKGEGTEIFELDGRAMLPGFVDSHGHVVNGGLQRLSANLLAPPDGEVTDIPKLQETLRGWMKDNAETVASVKMIIGFGYDQSQLAELRHPTREDLDKISMDVPILLVHQSSHLGAANSKALEMAGVTADTPDPAGGIYRRDSQGEPTGVLEENAFYAVLVKMLGGLGEDGFRAFAKAGTELWASFGYTTAQEGRSIPATVAVMRSIADEGGFEIDVVTYPDVLVDRDFILENVSQDYINRLRVAGAKLTIDGSPQGFTALRDRPYYDPVGDYPPGYSGYSSATMEQVNDVMDWAYSNGLQILTHANGEGASDMLIAATEAALAKYGPVGNRPVLIHGQFMREDQVDSVKRLGLFPSLFPMHTFYWGDWHREHTVGPVNADNISPTGWVRQRGMMFGTHHDAPVAYPDSMRVLDATVTRRTRSGDILGPDQRVDVMTALKAMTIWPAWQHFEEDKKGSLEVGKLADFVILSNDPTVIDPEDLDTLSVLVTIKEDKVIFEAPVGEDQGELRPGMFRNFFPSGDDPHGGHKLLELAIAATEAMAGE
ncbi:amidohydrolase [Falsihalocynthiibacter sp. S25ZX9]